MRDKIGMEAHGWMDAPSDVRSVKIRREHGPIGGWYVSFMCREGRDVCMGTGRGATPAEAWNAACISVGKEKKRRGIDDGRVQFEDDTE